MKWKFKDYMRVPGSCIITNMNITFRFYGLGKKFVWGQLPRVGYTLNNTLYNINLTQNDVIIFNMGLHWTELCHGKYHLVNDQYGHELLSIRVILKELDLCHKSGESIPLLIWRETFPQHFPTSNGLYPEGQRYHGEY